MRKCDRCGEKYDEYFLRIPGENERVHVTNGLTLLRGDLRQKKFHLCPECMQKVLDLLNEEKGLL